MHTNSHYQIYLLQMCCRDIALIHAFASCTSQDHIILPVMFHQTPNAFIPQSDISPILHPSPIPVPPHDPYISHLRRNTPYQVNAWLATPFYIPSHLPPPPSPFPSPYHLAFATFTAIRHSIYSDAWLLLGTPSHPLLTSLFFKT